MTEYQTPRLPRLLDRERVEVRLGINGTHVFEETGIDRLLSHLTEAKRLFRPDYDPATGASYESLVKELHLTRMALNEAAEVGECEWVYDDNEYAPKWDSSCGEAWCFIDGGPKENRVNYCHGCGKRVKVVIQRNPLITIPKTEQPSTDGVQLKEGK